MKMFGVIVDVAGGGGGLQGGAVEMVGVNVKSMDRFIFFLKLKHEIQNELREGNTGLFYQEQLSLGAWGFARLNL